MTCGDAVMALYHYRLCKGKSGLVTFHTRQTFVVDRKNIACNSRLGRMASRFDVVDVDPSKYNSTEFAALLSQQSNSVPLSKLEVFYQEYLEVIKPEVEMRKSMYQKGADKKYFQPHYELVKFSSVKLDKLYVMPKIDKKITEDEEKEQEKQIRQEASLKQGLLFPFQKLKKRSDNSYLSLFNDIIGKNKDVVVAGGAVFTSLFETSLNDVDVFLTTKDEKRGLQLVKEICEKFQPETVIRTENSITLLQCFTEHLQKFIKIQIILRLYSSISEVLHGFDVDCSCMGYDSEGVWMTKRCAHALKYGINTVNFDRLSPTYETRLVKYAARGMSIYVPKFDVNKVRDHRLEEDFNNKRIKLFNLRKKHEIEGLSVLLITNKRAMHRLGFYRFLGSKAQISDYSESIHKGYGSSLSELAEIAKSKAKYPDLRVNHIDPDLEDGHVKWTFVSGPLEEIDNILSVPASVANLLKKLEVEQELPLELKWKTTKPGEQMTNTFHKIVHGDVNAWYNGYYYGFKEESEEEVPVARSNRNKMSVSTSEANKRLTLAVQNNDTKAAEEAIEDGATNLNDSLNQAVRRGQFGMVELLVDRGANNLDKAIPIAEANRNDVILDYLRGEEEYRILVGNAEDDLLQAVQDGHIGLIRRAIQNNANNLEEALDLAIEENKDWNLIKILIEGGASPYNAAIKAIALDRSDLFKDILAHANLNDNKELNRLVSELGKEIDRKKMRLGERS